MCRIKIKNQLLDAVWSKWFTQPSDSYIEVAAQVPYDINAIEWIEINPIETRVEEKLTPAKEFDYT